MADTRAVAKRVAVKASVKQARSTQSGSFTAPHPVYSGGIYYEAGQVFVTSAPAGAMWEAMSGASVTSQ